MVEPNINLCKTKINWLVDNRIDTAIYIRNPKINPKHSGRGDGFVWVELDDVVLCACYFSPNRPFSEFLEFITCVDNALKNYKNKLVISGDFNAKSLSWGCQREDLRGEALNLWMASLNIRTVNVGHKPTFLVNERSSIIDVTLASPKVKIFNWQVLDSESLSDHRMIFFSITWPNKTNIIMSNNWSTKNIAFDQIDICAEVFEKMEEPNLDDLTSALHDACSRSMTRRKSPSPNKKMVYWWNNEIAELRRSCIAKRRKMMREKQNILRRIELQTEYRLAKKQLRSTIYKAKSKAWQEILDEVENDIWGLGYRIVSNKISSRAIVPRNIRRQAIIQLFPNRPEIYRTFLTSDQPIPLITTSEVVIASKKIKSGKAAGPDTVPPEIVKIFVLAAPNKVAEIMNQCLSKGNFPLQWKKARLSLLLKPNKSANNPTSYRPLCLLDVIGKMFEHILVERILIELADRGGLSDKQYGFCKNKSTVHAAVRVLDIAKKELKKTLKTRGFCMLVTLDVRNAFNSAAWNWILSELRNKNISPYLINIISSYLNERVVIDEEGEEWPMTCGVPQGSVMGPLLWNIMYDPILSLPFPEGIEVIGYADDVALIGTNKCETHLEFITS